MQRLRKILLLLVAIVWFSASIPARASGASQTVEAVQGILAAFDKYPIVAIGEQHGIQELGEFYQALIQHPDFPKKADGIVMEYGNALHQEIADRYVAGEDVPYAELRKVWSDAAGRIPGGTEIMYGQIYGAVRAVNSGQPASERLRVWLGDPPVDWSRINTREDLMPFQMQRETHYAGVVTGEVLDKNLKALVITGGPHLDRGTGQPSGVPGAQVMQQIVEGKYPGKTYVILVHTGFADEQCNADAESRMQTWTVPTLATIKGSWLAELRCAKFPPALMINTNGISGNPPGNQMIGVPLKGTPAALPNPPPNLLPGATPREVGMEIGNADAYLFVGMKKALTMSPFAPDIYLDTAYFAEQSRRHQFMFGSPLDPTRMLQGNPRSYVDNFPR